MSLVLNLGRTAALVVGLSILGAAPAALLAQAAPASPVAPPPTKPEPVLKPAGTPTTVTEVVDGQNQMPMLQSNGEQLLQDDAAKYRAIIAQGGFARVPAFAFKKGDKSANVASLNTRLYQEGYLRVEGTQGQFADSFTSATKDSLVRFQRNHGLTVTGKVDSPTLAELNVPADQRLATIEANIPRLAVYQQGLGDRYLVVNVPAQQAEAVAGGRVFERHNTIVGRPARPTPVVMTGIETVKFNPYWNAPSSIVQRDIVPKVQADPGYLQAAHIKILKGGPTGPEVDPKTLDFKNLVPEDYLFREEPGPENAMATAKIEFKSPFGIYLHDTPEKQMFNFNNRFFSSGCIRIQNMPTLVNWVLNGKDGYNPDKIANMAKTLERLDVSMSAPLQLRVAYLTAWPSAGGTVSFRNDIYQMDGSGFIVGQPMPVGEMSPDNKRYVLKPLPRAQSIDAAEAEGSGFFGFKTSRPAAPQTTTGVTKLIATKLATSTAPPASAANGFFDWPGYYKKQAAQEKAGATKDAKKKTKKTKSGKATANAAGKKPTDAKATGKKVADKKVKDKKATDKMTTANKLAADKKPEAKKPAPKSQDICKTDGDVNVGDNCTTRVVIPAPDAKPAEAPAPAN